METESNFHCYCGCRIALLMSERVGHFVCVDCAPHFFQGDYEPESD